MGDFVDQHIISFLLGFCGCLLWKVARAIGHIQKDVIHLDRKVAEILWELKSQGIIIEKTPEPVKRKRGRPPKAISLPTKIEEK